MVKSLFEDIADPNALNSNGQAPLHVASIAGHSKIVEILLRHGADFNLYNNEGHTPLFVATLHGNL